MESLSDDEVRDMACGLLLASVSDAYSAKGLRVRESGDDILFIVSLPSAEVTYKPRADAERIIRQSVEKFKEPSEGRPKWMWKWLIQNDASEPIRLLVNNFRLEFEEMVNDLPEVARDQGDTLRGIRHALYMGPEGEAQPPVPKPARQTLTGAQFRNRQQRFLNLANEVKADLTPRLLLISSAYVHLQPTWREVKKRYRRYRISPKWRDLLARDFAEHNLPPDLIDRLDETKPVDKYDRSSAVLALEHSVRLCGARPNQFGRRRLQDLLKESREWEATCSREDYLLEMVKWSLLLGHPYDLSMNKIVQSGQEGMLRYFSRKGRNAPDSPLFAEN